MTKKFMSVHEVAELTGITARTLHYYDEIGLLKPTKVTDAGYRMYDGTALSRLQSVLLFRELEFPLKEIKAILDNPDFDQSEVIAQQIKLLELQYKHIGELITFTREIQKKGVTALNFDVFDKREIEKYEAEVKAKWGNTKAYQEYKQKDIARNGGSYSKIANELLTMFSELGGLKHLTPNSDEVQKKISELQKFITDNYYVCTNEILSGLGEMYVCDERFKNNIDKAGGDGTADFVGQAIVVYCSKKKVQ
ncbi:MerR family transcriptional regulator [Lachnospiraceae bacterium 45-W7]